MHKSALTNASLFFQTYVPYGENLVVVEIGSQDLNGSIRQFAPSGTKYIGVDFVEGSGVDIKLDDPYKLPFADNSVDICISSSVFEHAEFFWLSFLEILRILKQDGLFYLNAPTNGFFHRFPVDCWRFYPDSGKALVNWAKRNNYSPCLLESFVSTQEEDVWNDFVAVYVKEEAYAAKFKERIVYKKNSFFNGFTSNNEDISNYTQITEDHINIIRMKEACDNQLNEAMPQQLPPNGSI